MSRAKKLGWLVFCLALVGCSSSAKQPSVDAAQLRRAFGLESGPDSLEIATQAFDASQKEIVQCVRSQGFDYVAIELSDEQSVQVEEFASNYSAEYIDKLGFGAATIPFAPPEGSAAVRQNRQIYESLDSDAARATYAAAIDDCTAAEGRKLVPMQQRSAEIAQQLQVDADFQAASTSWALCSASRGYPFASFTAAQDHFAQIAESVGPTDSPARRQAAAEELRAAAELKQCTVELGEVRNAVVQRLIDAV